MPLQLPVVMADGSASAGQLLALPEVLPERFRGPLPPKQLEPLQPPGEWAYIEAKWFDGEGEGGVRVKNNAPTQMQIKNFMFLRQSCRKEGNWKMLAKNSVKVMARWPLMAAAVAHGEHHARVNLKRAAAKRRLRLKHRHHQVPADLGSPPAADAPPAPAVQAQHFGMVPPQHFGIGGKGPREPREFRVDNRAWGNNRPLDLVAAPDAYLVWHDFALGGRTCASSSSGQKARRGRSSRRSWSRRPSSWACRMPSSWTLCFSRASSA